MIYSQAEAVQAGGVFQNVCKHRAELHARGDVISDQIL
jgi:hypothetical protein